MKKLHHASLLATLGLSLTLVACGGNDDDEVLVPDIPSTSAEVPASATASTTAYRNYAASLVNSETALPLDVNRVTPPTSETEVAQAI